MFAELVTNLSTVPSNFFLFSQLCGKTSLISIVLAKIFIYGTAKILLIHFSFLHARCFWEEQEHIGIEVFITQIIEEDMMI